MHCETSSVATFGVAMVKWGPQSLAGGPNVNGEIVLDDSDVELLDKSVEEKSFEVQPSSWTSDDTSGGLPSMTDALFRDNVDRIIEELGERNKNLAELIVKAFTEKSDDAPVQLRLLAAALKVNTKLRDTVVESGPSGVPSLVSQNFSQWFSSNLTREKPESERNKAVDESPSSEAIPGSTALPTPKRPKVSSSHEPTEGAGASERAQ